MQSREKVFKNLMKFRSQMGKSLSREDIKYIWGRRFLKNLEQSKEKGVKKELTKLRGEENEYVRRKMKIAKKNVDKLKVFNWVRFIGISGSVAAGFAEKEDDIDVFVVVRNGTIWLYRALVVFRNLFHNKIRAKRHKDITNKLCLNLVCEERGLNFPNDIFNFHELMFLKPIYNKKYKRYILSQNKWLRKQFSVKKELLRSRVIPEKKAFFLIRTLNFFAFVAQLVFMIISGHGPDIKRLKENYKKGRIEFFEYDFRIEKIKDYSTSKSN
jgi:predicted nucleotidyltransferase